MIYNIGKRVRLFGFEDLGCGTIAKVVATGDQEKALVLWDDSEMKDLTVEETIWYKVLWDDDCDTSVQPHTSLI